MKAQMQAFALVLMSQDWHRRASSQDVAAGDVGQPAAHLIPINKHDKGCYDAV